MFEHFPEIIDPIQSKPMPERHDENRSQVKSVRSDDDPSFDSMTGYQGVVSYSASADVFNTSLLFVTRLLIL